MRAKSDHRYRSELRLRRWLRYRGWQHWAVWRWVAWGILMAVFSVTVSMCYAYR